MINLAEKNFIEKFRREILFKKLEGEMEKKYAKIFESQICETVFRKRSFLLLDFYIIYASLFRTGRLNGFHETKIKHFYTLDSGKSKVKMR